MGVHFYGSLAGLPGLARDITGAAAVPLLAGVVFLVIALAAVPVYLMLTSRKPA